MNVHTIDTPGKTVGRTASKAAMILMGKDKPTFQRNTVAGKAVRIVNASKAKINPKNMDAKVYLRYSGYPGGLKEEKMKRTIEKKGYAEVFREAIYGMLPDNKLRSRLMKQLIITE